MLPIAVADGVRDVDQVAHGALEVVVLDHVVEDSRLAKLAVGEVEALADLTRALRRALAEPPFELGPRGRDEDGDDAGQLLGDLERPFRLQLEDGDAPLVPDPLDLRTRACRSAGRRRT